MASLFKLALTGPRLLVGALEAIARFPREMESLRAEIHGVRVEVELDDVVEDVLVLPLQLLEETAKDRRAHLFVGAQKLAAGAIEGQLAQADRAGGLVHLRCIQRHARRFDAVIRALKIDFVRELCGEKITEDAGRKLVIGPQRLESVGQSHVTAVQQPYLRD